MWKSTYDETILPKGVLMRKETITIYKVTCDCGHEIKTSKKKNIQCRSCGKRFDL